MLFGYVFFIGPLGWIGKHTCSHEPPQLSIFLQNRFRKTSAKADVLNLINLRIVTKQILSHMLQ